MRPQESNFENLIIHPKIAITSMQDSGYKNASYAVAELIDNSIQAGEGLNRKISVEVLCLEEAKLISQRNVNQVTKIGVYDNASGMPPDVLRKALQFGGTTRRHAATGIGKFGMGLPNASISQCNKVEVYSWQNKTIYYSYLDISEISSGAQLLVPEPIVKKQLPELWRNMIKNYNPESGTLVVWSELERLEWKRHNAFFSNTAFLAGRMYRYFIPTKAEIRLAAYANGELLVENYVVPNDPLYLTTGSNCPAPYDKVPAFELFMEEDIPVKFRNTKHNIHLKFSMATNDTRQKASDSKHSLSKHCAQNIGISVVRAGRELELNNSFLNSGAYSLERWWGVEVSFDPALDQVFGVTNNKQCATRFNRVGKEEIADMEGMGLDVSAVMDSLKQDNDPRYIILQVSLEIESQLTQIRERIKRQREGERAARITTPKNKTNVAATTVAENRASDGKIGTSDTKKQSKDEEKNELTDLINKDDSIPQDEKEQTLKAWLESGKFIFHHAPTSPSYGMFDLGYPAGKIKITLNEQHPIWSSIFKRLEDEGQSGDIYNALWLLFAAWARQEDEAEIGAKRNLELQRNEWGRIVADMLDKYKEEE